MLFFSLTVLFVRMLKHKRNPTIGKERRFYEKNDQKSTKEFTMHSGLTWKIFLPGMKCNTGEILRFYRSLLM